MDASESAVASSRLPRRRKVKAAVEAVPSVLPLVHGIAAWDYNPVNEQPFCGVSPLAPDVKFHRTIQGDRITCPACMERNCPIAVQCSGYGNFYRCPRPECGEYSRLHAVWIGKDGSEKYVRTVRRRNDTWRWKAHPATFSPCVPRKYAPILRCQDCLGKLRLPVGVTLERSSDGKYWGRKAH